MNTFHSSTSLSRKITNCSLTSLTFTNHETRRSVIIIEPEKDTNVKVWSKCDERQSVIKEWRTSKCDQSVTNVKVGSKCDERQSVIKVWRTSKCDQTVTNVKVGSKCDERQSVIKVWRTSKCDQSVTNVKVWPKCDELRTVTTSSIATIINRVD